MGRQAWRGVIRGCYRDSRAASAVLAGMLSLHRGLGTFHNKVTRYIALNDFCREKFVKGGLPEDRVVVKPNFVDWDADGPQPGPFSGRGEGRRDLLFVGRLSSEKGIATLADAKAKLADLSLRIAGEGPSADLFDGVSGVVRLGSLTPEEVRGEMARALVLVLPSIWYENFPRTIVEAFASGLPVIASRIGALADIVEEGVTGLLFVPGDADDLADKMAWAVSHPEEVAVMGQNARAKYQEAFSPDVNYRQLMTIYEAAIAESASQEGGSNRR